MMLYTYYGAFNSISQDLRRENDDIRKGACVRN